MPVTPVIRMASVVRFPLSLAFFGFRINRLPHWNPHGRRCRDGTGVDRRIVHPPRHLSRTFSVHDDARIRVHGNILVPGGNWRAGTCWRSRSPGDRTRLRVLLLRQIFDRQRGNDDAALQQLLSRVEKQDGAKELRDLAATLLIQL